MEEVLQYLALKNEYFSKFFAMTSKFLEKTNHNEWQDIHFFIDNRERILNIVRYFDFKIAKYFEEIDTEGKDLNDYKERVKQLLQERDSIVKKIVDLDLELSSRIDNIKTETIQDLKESQKTSQRVNAFYAAPHEPDLES